jgi:hypothetical protein
MKKSVLALVGLMVLAATAYGGWEHLVIGGVGRTQWTESPTAASCWIRNNSTYDACPAIDVAVYFNTIRSGSTNSFGTVISYGLWSMDSNGDYAPSSTVGVVDYENRLLPAWRYDVEWSVDSEGDLYLKE